jgi:DNA invertase Pin-like site-specific DNA recombinase
MKCAIYSRVSTTDQTVRMQLEELHAYCKRRRFTIVGEFSDSGISGFKESRPGLNRMMADARRRKFDAVVVYRYDRFARSLRQLVNALAEFDALGIDFISLYEGVDTSTPTGRLTFGIFASIAEFERSLITDRVKSGQQAARRHGVKFGRPRVEVDAGRLAKLRDKGASFAAISKETGLSVGTVFRALSPAGNMQIFKSTQSH